MNRKGICLFVFALISYLFVRFIIYNDELSDEVVIDMDSIVGIGDPIEVVGGDTPRPESFEIPNGVQSYKVVYSEAPLEEYKTNVTTVKNLGEFSIINYLSEGGLTYSGTEPKVGSTVAVDPDVIKIGSHILVDGDEYVAEDTYDLVKGNCIGILRSSEDEYKPKYCTEVYLIED